MKGLLSGCLFKDQLMIITDQEEIMSFARDRWRDNPQPCSTPMDWNDFCYYNAAEPQKILVRAASDVSLSDALDHLYMEIKSLGYLEPRTVILGLSEKTPSLTMQQLFNYRQSISELIPGGTTLLQEVLWSDRAEAVALLFME